MTSYLPIPLDQAAARAPAAMRQRMAAGVSISQNFQDGIRDSFPLLSIKGRMFTARYSGVSKVYPDPNNPQQIAQSVDFIMLNASRNLSKAYYIKGYSEGDLNPPDCWSLDAVRPDPSVVNKVSPSCINCPMNQFGSKITPAGKAAKACQDARRLALLQPHMLGQPEPMAMLLRVPQSSLKNLKTYAQMLQRHSVDTNAVITRLSFDYSPEVAFPKLLFNYVGMLDDMAYAKVMELAEGDMVRNMLNAPDFEDTITQPPVQNPQTGAGLQGLAPQPAVEPVDMGAVNLQMPAEQATQVYQPQTTTPVQQQPQPVQQQPNLQLVPEDQIIDLGDGKFWNNTTKQYVQPPQPKVEMPTLDPMTIELPGPQWFNQTTKKYVTGPQLGAPEVTAAPATATRKRTTAKKDQPAQQQAAPELKLVESPAPQVQTPPANETAAVNSGQNVMPQTPPANGNGDAANAQAPVNAAPPGLEQILSKLLPPANQ